MGRPKKRRRGQGAREAIIEAFWELLEDHVYEDISVGMIVSKAGINRSTFYYHFNDRIDLLEEAIESEATLDGNLCEQVFGLLAPDGMRRFDKLLSSRRPRQLAMLENNGGMDIARRDIYSYNVQRIEHAVHPDGGRLTNSSRRVIGMYTSMVITLVVQIGLDNAAYIVTDLPREYVASMCRLTVESLARYESLGEREMREVLRSSRVP